jgi:hypothetical protein
MRKVSSADGPGAATPVSCFQSSRTAFRRCETCGEHPNVIHIPIHYAGLDCEKCCPACSQNPAVKG